MAALILLSALTGQGWAVGDDLALPDKVVLKEGVTLPFFTTEREIDCLVLEENGEKVVFNTSRKQGVEERREVPMSDVAKVVRGDRSARGFDLIRNHLALPPDSLNEAFYLNAIAVYFDPFLKQNPGSPHQAEVERAIDAYRGEWTRIRQGDVRVGDVWYDAVTYQRERPDLQARECLVRLNQAVAARHPEQFSDILAEIAKYKGSAVYPDLVEAARKGIPVMGEMISPDLLQEKTKEEISYLETEIQRQAIMISEIVNQEPHSQPNNWKKDPNLVFYKEANAWYGKNEINKSDFSSYFTDTVRPRLKLDPVSKERVEQYIVGIENDKKTLSKLEKALSKTDDTISERKGVLDKFAKTYAAVDVEALRAVQKDLERIEAGLAEKSPDTPSHDDYEKALEKEGKKPAAAAARLQALGLTEAVDDPGVRKEAIVRIIADSDKAMAFVTRERAKLEEDAAVWPENYDLLRLNQVFDEMHAAASAFSAKAYEKILDLPPGEADGPYSRWLKNRKVEAGVVLDMMELNVQAAGAAIQKGDSWKAIEHIDNIRDLTPTNPALRNLSQQAYARLDEYRAEGKPAEAAQFIPVMSAAWKSNPDIREAENKFGWIHFWGYSTALNQPRVIITAVIYFFVGIALIGFLTGVVIKFLRRFKR